MVIVINQVGEPLIRLTADKSIKALKAHSKRPVIEWSRVAGFVGRRLMPLANVERALAGLLQYLCDRRLTSRHPPVVTGITRRGLGDYAHMIGVMIITGEQAGSRR